MHHITLATILATILTACDAEPSAPQLTATSAAVGDACRTAPAHATIQITGTGKYVVASSDVEPLDRPGCAGKLLVDVVGGAAYDVTPLARPLIEGGWGVAADECSRHEASLALFPSYAERGSPGLLSVFEYLFVGDWVPLSQLCVPQEADGKPMTTIRRASKIRLAAEATFYSLQCWDPGCDNANLLPMPDWEALAIVVSVPKP